MLTGRSKLIVRQLNISNPKEGKGLLTVDINSI
jgi:hypothetical protein